MSSGPYFYPEGLIHDALGQQRSVRQSDKRRKINRGGAGREEGAD